MPLELNGDCLKLSVRQFVIQSSPISQDHIIRYNNDSD